MGIPSAFNSSSAVWILRAPIWKCVPVSITSPPPKILATRSSFRQPSDSNFWRSLRIATLPYLGLSRPCPFQSGSIKWFMPPMFLLLSKRQTATQEPRIVETVTASLLAKSAAGYKKCVSRVGIPRTILRQKRSHCSPRHSLLPGVPTQEYVQQKAHLFLTRSQQ